jgi:hypothetical protein
MISPPLQSLIDSITRVTQADARIQSAWLQGSLAVDDGDEWSDVDVLLVTAEPDIPALVQHYKANVAAIAEPAHVYGAFPTILNVVTDDWLRFDLLFAPPSALARFAPSNLKKLFARDGAAAPSGQAQTQPPEALDPLVREFLRVLGLGAVVLNRREYMVSLDGMGLLRGMIVDLFMIENGRRRDRGVKRVNQFLTGEQRAALEALPPLSATRESSIAYMIGAANLFLPRARTLTKAQNATWPEDFLSATRAYLKRELDLTI